MNLILFEREEIGVVIPGYDPRAKHIRRTLRLKEGDAFQAGIVNGQLGSAKILTQNKIELIIDFQPNKEKPTPYPVILIVGLTRPQIAKQIFRESASMGIEKLWFYPTELGEKSYLESDLWQEMNYRPQLIKGAGQGFTTNLPDVKIFKSLANMFSKLPETYERICLDNVRPESSLSNYVITKQKVSLLLGSERGFTDRERNRIEANAFSMVHMGERVLRTDTACIAGLTLVLSKLGKM